MSLSAYHLIGDIALNFVETIVYTSLQYGTGSQQKQYIYH